MKHRYTCALLLAGALLGQAAQAGELTLYTHDNFGGRGISLREAAPTLREFGFNDRASSMVVQSGRWEVCTDADFRGSCTVVGPGEYPSLPGLNDMISSVREVGGWRRHEREAGARGWQREHDEYRQAEARPGAPVLLFAQERMRGEPLALGADAPDFNAFGFNDRAASLLITEGQWEFCLHANYGGQCVIYGPGSYPLLGVLDRRISSMRRVRF